MLLLLNALTMNGYLLVTFEEHSFAIVDESSSIPQYSFLVATTNYWYTRNNLLTLFRLTKDSNEGQSKKTNENYIRIRSR